MSRVNITLPDDLHRRARAAGLNVSRLAQSAVTEELERRAKIAELEACLHDLEAELGPIPDAEREAAERWADGLFGSASAARTA